MSSAYGSPSLRRDVRPPVRPVRMVFSWLVGALAVFLAAALLPGFNLGSLGEALVVAFALAAINAVLPPLVAALRLPYTVATTLLLVLLVNALAFELIEGWTDDALEVGGFGVALIAALVVTAITMALSEILGADDDDVYSLRVIHRLARRARHRVETDLPGIVYLYKRTRTATRRCCAPSWRSRSSLRRSPSMAATIRRRESWSSFTELLQAASSCAFSCTSSATDPAARSSSGSSDSCASWTIAAGA